MTARNTETVLFVGDSSTFGFGVPSGDSSARAERCVLRIILSMLRCRDTPAAIVAQLLALLQATTPKWLVVGLPWSDFMHSTVSDEKRLERAGTVGRVLRIIEHPVFSRSFIAQWLLLKAEQSRKSTPIELDSESILDPNASGSARRVSAAQHLSNVQKIAKLSRRKGVRLVLPHLPRNPRVPGPGPATPSAATATLFANGARTNDVPLVEGNRLLERLPLEQQARHFPLTTCTPASWATNAWLQRCAAISTSALRILDRKSAPPSLDLPAPESDGLPAPPTPAPARRSPAAGCTAADRAQAQD